MPGRLSVSRTFGDIEAKHPQFGGKEGVVSCRPDVFSFTEAEVDGMDFMVLGSDGVFDKLSSEEVLDCAR
jgi:protein phosphatase 2C family protein 2/3